MIISRELQKIQQDSSRFLAEDSLKFEAITPSKNSFLDSLLKAKSTPYSPTTEEKVEPSEMAHTKPSWLESLQKPAESSPSEAKAQKPQLDDRQVEQKQAIAIPKAEKSQQESEKMESKPAKGGKEPTQAQSQQTEIQQKQAIEPAKETVQEQKSESKSTPARTRPVKVDNSKSAQEYELNLATRKMIRTTENEKPIKQEVTAETTDVKSKPTDTSTKIENLQPKSEKSAESDVIGRRGKIEIQYSRQTHPSNQKVSEENTEIRNSETIPEKPGVKIRTATNKSIEKEIENKINPSIEKAVIHKEEKPIDLSAKSESPRAALRQQEQARTANQEEISWEVRKQREKLDFDSKQSVKKSEQAAVKVQATTSANPGRSESFESFTGKEDNHNQAFTPLSRGEKTAETTSNNRPESFINRQNFKNSLQNLVQKARVHIIQNGKSSAQVALNPKSLGKMTLNISVLENKVEGRLMVESEAIKNILLNEIQQFRQDLKATGLQLENIEVDVRPDEGSANFFAESKDGQFDQTEQEQAGNSHLPSAELEETGESDYSRSERALDIKI